MSSPCFPDGPPSGNRRVAPPARAFGKCLRAPYRFILFATHLLLAQIEFMLSGEGLKSANDYRARANWQARTARRLLRVLGVRVHHAGPPPKRGFLVSNHLGYIDILVLAAAGHVIFVSKDDVKKWPALGRMAAQAGTLFLKRGSAKECAKMLDQMTAVSEQEVVVGFFPEGTSSGGDSVLPFHAALFEAAFRSGRAVTPAAIHYQVAEGSAADEICYWGEMTFLPHLWNLLSKSEIRAHAIFGAPLEPESDRRALCLASHAAVAALLSRCKTFQQGEPSNVTDHSASF